MTKDYKEEAKGLIKGKVLFNVPMKEFTSIKVGGPADCLLYPEDVKELRRVICWAKQKKIPVFVLGKGTNLIVRDRGIRGWVVSLARGIKGVRLKGEAIEAEAGCSLQHLVRLSVEKGFKGLEALAGIPGTVGGGLAMNAGAWGVELKDIVTSVTLMKKGGEIIERPRSGLRFSYRRLALSPETIILKGRFRLEKGRKEEILGRMKSYSGIRKRTQPLGYPSAGSIFKNPEEGPAGKLIEEAGLKGFRMGQAMVSDCHANFIVNLGRATAEEILGLMTWVEKKVYDEKGVSLEREVRVVGEP